MSSQDPKYTALQVHDGVLQLARELDGAASSETELEILVRDTFIPMINEKFFPSAGAFHPDDFADTDTAGTVMIRVALRLQAQGRLI